MSQDLFCSNDAQKISNFLPSFKQVSLSKQTFYAPQFFLTYFFPWLSYASCIIRERVNAWGLPKRPWSSWEYDQQCQFWELIMRWRETEQRLFAFVSHRRIGRTEFFRILITGAASPQRICLQSPVKSLPVPFCFSLDVSQDCQVCRESVLFSRVKMHKSTICLAFRI